MTRYAALDGDVVLYQALSRNLMPFGDADVVDLHNAKKDFESIIFDWIRAAGPKEYQLFLSDYSNFRKDLYPKYKSHRGEKPAGFQEFKEWVIHEYDVKLLPGLEADDCIGICLTDHPGSVSVSIDKDMLTIPGDHYNPGKGTLTRSTLDDANLFWLRQGLMGDSTDGYPGIPMVGKVGASNILHTAAPVDVLWTAYLRAYEAKGMTEEDALTQARLARILRTEDYDRRTGTVGFSRPNALERHELPPEYRSDVSPSGYAATPRHRRKADRSGPKRREDHGGLTNDQL